MTPPQQSSLQRQAEAAQAPAVPQEDPHEAVRAAVARLRPVIANALPRHMGVDQFLATIYHAVKATPRLLECDPESIVGAALKAASLGLTPADGRGQCAIIPRWNRTLYGSKPDLGGMEATYQTMYRGAVDLARRAGVHRIVARTVYAFDHFDYELGLAERLVHQPCPNPAERGDATAWYAIAWDKAGAMLDFTVLTRADVEYHRSFSSQANSPMWEKAYDAAARKTAVWELVKLLPQSPELADAINSDDRVVRVGTDGPLTVPEAIAPRVPVGELSPVTDVGDADAPAVPQASEAPVEPTGVGASTKAELARQALADAEAQAGVTPAAARAATIAHRHATRAPQDAVEASSEPVEPVTRPGDPTDG